MRNTLYKVLIVFLLFLVPAAAFSQDIKIGIKAGVGLPFYTGEDYDNFISPLETQIVIGWGGGAFISLGFDMIAIQVELLYTAAGGQFGDSSGSWVNYDNFLEIPVLVKLRFKISEMTAYVFAGPDVLIKAGDFDFETFDADGNSTATGNWIDDNLEPVQYGLVIGGGLDIPMGSYFISVDVRYMLGITTRHNEDMPALTGQEWYQNNIQLMVGFGISL
ncbi:MAG: PorT family protein [Spirochaetales bacterium]|nr:PorT family protein [Spirochaetales bacterium]